MMNDNHQQAIAGLSSVQQNTGAVSVQGQGLPTSMDGNTTASSPVLPASSVGVVEHGHISTPLQKAVHAAAALASVTAGDSASGHPTSGVVPSIPSLAQSIQPIVIHTASIPHSAVARKPISAPPTSSSSSPHILVHAGGPMHGSLPGGMAVQFPPFATSNAPPGTFYQMTAASKAVETPAVFRGHPQRSGKWTREEEIYADLLIELFEKGHIDEKNGSTLRSFLSRKLHCAPMRISKKYAGKGIGKMVFISKNNCEGMVDGIGSPAYHQNMKRLRTAEENFYKICFPELSLQLPSSAANMTPNPILPQLNPMNQSTITSTLLPLPNQIQQGNGVAPALPQQQGVAAYWIPVQATTAPVAAAPVVPATFPPSTNAPAPKPSTAAQARNALEEAYLSVARSVQQAQAPVTAPAARKADQIHEVVASQNALALQRIYYGGDGGTAAQIAKVGAAQNDARIPSSSEGAQTSKATATTQHSMPDFLSAFDKVAQHGKTNHQVPTTSHDHSTSPSALTSPSFDDFHRLLGKGLSPVKGQNNAPPTIPPPAVGVGQLPAPQLPVAPAVQYATVQPHGLSYRPNQQAIMNPHQLLGQAYGEALSSITTTKANELKSLGADSYNIFAQQSAIAASQHSAYMSSNKPTKRQKNENSMRPIDGPNSSATFAEQSASTTPTGTNPSTNFRAMFNPTVVSEPSNASDQGAEESDDSPADPSESDETNSESSRKRARIATQDAVSATRGNARIGPNQ